jgi:hypothetical protein
MAGRAPAVAVAATGQETDPDGVRMPAGEVPAWQPGRNETACGLALSRSRLIRFPHVTWVDVQPDTGGHADYVGRVCPRCAAALGARRDGKSWRRVDPRP